MNESPEQKYSRLQSEIQGAILSNYPNPDRQGCPGETTIRGFAKNPDSITVEDETDEHSAWYHVTHCSPCYASFLQMRDAERVNGERQRITRRAVFATCFSAGIAGVGWIVWRRNRILAIELDLDKYAAFRGGNDGVQLQSKLELPNGRLHVTLKLPSGSPDGVYSAELRRPTRDGVIFARTVPATLEGGFQKLRFDAELHVNPGVYTLAIRNDHRESWRYYSVSVD
jgi:hypothetical protein